MPESDEEVQRLVEEVFGFKPCLWQILVVRAVLAGEDVITVAPTGSGKSLTYWIPLLYIKHSITVVISPLKLLGTQFAQMLAVNRISAISIFPYPPLRNSRAVQGMHVCLGNENQCEDVLM